MRRFKSILIITILILIAVGCSHAPQPIKAKKDLITFLDNLGAEYEAICGEIAEANYLFYTQTQPVDQDTAKRKLAALLLDDSNRKIINTWFQRIKPGEDERLAYRLKIWHRVMTIAQVDFAEEIYQLQNELEERYSNFQYTVDGKKCTFNEAYKLLVDKYRHNLQELYRERWLLDAQRSKAMEGDLLLLMKKRNQRAKSLGFSNYAELVLWAHDIKSAWYRDLIDKFERRTHLPYQKSLEEGKNVSAIQEVTPWNLETVILSRVRDDSEGPGYDRERVYRFSNEELLRTSINDIGFNFDELPVKRSESESMLYGGLCLAIRIPYDVRVAFRPGSVPLGTLLHEYGHAIHLSHVAVKEPIFKGYEITGAGALFWIEAMANIISTLSGNVEWQKKWRGYSEEFISWRKAEFWKMEAFRTRYYRLMNIEFELQAYENLEQDLSELYKSLYRKHLVLEWPKDEPVPWASSVTLATIPFYSVNTFVTQIIEWQIRQTLEEKFGTGYVFNKEVAHWLIENLYQMGESIPWTKRLENTTGKALDVDGYLKSQGY